MMPVHQVSAASQFGLRSERDPTYAWQHRLCGENFYNDIDPVTGLLTCERCPMGADCVNSTTTREVSCDAEGVSEGARVCVWLC